VLIRPHVASIGIRDFEQKNQAILEGEKAAEAAIPALLEAIRVWQAAQRKALAPA
jgi:NTE family protein